MQVAEGRMGRVFVLRLEDGDTIPGSIEAFAKDKKLESAYVALLGGVGGGRLVVGPEDSDAAHIEPVLRAVAGAHETVGVGTLFPDEAGEPALHMHASLGRGDAVATGCVRPGLDVWRVVEAVVIEITGTGMRRKLDPAFGFEILSTE